MEEIAKQFENGAIWLARGLEPFLREVEAYLKGYEEEIIEEYAADIRELENKIEALTMENRGLEYDIRDLKRENAELKLPVNRPCEDCHWKAKCCKALRR